MNFWEELGLSIFTAILRQLHFDAAKHATLKNVLVPIRDTLLVLYPLDTPAGPAQP